MARKSLILYKLFNILCDNVNSRATGIAGPSADEGRLSKRRRAMTLQREAYIVKGTVSRDFLFLVFDESVSLQIQSIPLGPFRIFFENSRRRIFPPVSLVLFIPVAYFATGVDAIGGKFATGVNDAGGKLPPVSTIPVANNGNKIRPQTSLSELEGKN